MALLDLDDRASRHVKSYAVERLEILQRKLENQNTDFPSTQVVRGQILEMRALLRLMTENSSR